MNIYNYWQSTCKPMLLFITLNAWGYLGDVARGEQTENSDIDICYEGEAPTLFTLVRIKYELEALLGRPVDLVRVREKMDEVLKQTIQEEAIYV